MDGRDGNYVSLRERIANHNRKPEPIGNDLNHDEFERAYRNYRPSKHTVHISTANSKDLADFYLRRLKKDEFYRRWTFDQEYDKLILMAYEKKDFQKINEWINALIKNPQDWKNISKAKKIRVTIDETVSKSYLPHTVLGAWYQNNQFGFYFAKNWLEVFKNNISKKGTELFAANVRAMYAHETHHAHQIEKSSKTEFNIQFDYIQPQDKYGMPVVKSYEQKMEIDAYAAQIGQYCKELNFIPWVALETLAHVKRREQLSQRLKEKFNCDMLEIYFKYVTNPETQKKFLWEVYDYLILNS